MLDDQMKLPKDAHTLALTMRLLNKYAEALNQQNDEIKRCQQNLLKGESTVNDLHEQVSEVAKLCGASICQEEISEIAARQNAMNSVVESLKRKIWQLETPDEAMEEDEREEWDEEQLKILEESRVIDRSARKTCCL
ncbi:hypothetical protein L3Y34_002172 [Caenorhabditis briggsae]|uniref:Uncharacterized protein n=1 Tax=Caenorhabditis briggsae TaxID=6238 RepID=A0AAE9DE58_CAEBR|nr:hypothetical protein L3Y34_002172 [Caenorhabditis briggsae]